MRLALVDIETTGWNPVYARVIELGVVLVENGEVVETFETLIKPVRPKALFSRGITELTGITEADLEDAPSFGEIAPKLEGFLADSLFVAHNVSFDYGFLYYEFSRLGREFHFPRACTVRLSRKMFPEIPRHRLEDLIRWHQIPVARRHRALDDAKVLYEIMQKCEARWGRADLYKTLGSLTNSSKMVGI